MPRLVTDDGVRIVYQVWNRPSALPPLVLHHGFTGDATWDWVETGVVAALTAANRTVIAPDARGHGGSDKPRQPSAYGEARMTRDLTQLIDALAVPQIDLVGFSMGAVVALLAATADQRIRRLAIVGVGAGVVELGGVDRRALQPDALAAALLADDSTAIEVPAAAAFRTNAEARGADLLALAAHAPGDPCQGHPAAPHHRTDPCPRRGRRSLRGAPGAPCFRDPGGAAQDPGRRPRHRDHQSAIRRKRHDFMGSGSSGT